MLIALATLILAGLVVAYIALPLVRGTAEESTATPEVKAFPANVPVEDLLFEHEATLKMLRDLDFDFEMGKLSEADYRELRARYAAQGVAVLQRLDEVALEGVDAEIEDEIEQEVRRLREAVPVQPVAVADGHVSEQAQFSPDGLDEEIEREIQRLRRREPTQVIAGPPPVTTPATAPEPAPVRMSAPTGKCPECGHPVRRADKFCANCGASLTLRCPSCGAVAAPQDRFCAGCGTAIKRR